MINRLIETMGVIAMAWTVLLFICNPWLENKRAKIAMIGCAVVATICWFIHRMIN